MGVHWKVASLASCPHCQRFSCASLPVWTAFLQLPTYLVHLGMWYTGLFITCLVSPFDDKLTVVAVTATPTIACSALPRWKEHSSRASKFIALHNAWVKSKLLNLALRSLTSEFPCLGWLSFPLNIPLHPPSSLSSNLLSTVFTPFASIFSSLGIAFSLSIKCRSILPAGIGPSFLRESLLASQTEDCAD